MLLNKPYLNPICILILISISGCTLFGEKTVIQKEPVYLKVVCQPLGPVSRIITRPVRPRAVEDKVGIMWVGLIPEDYANVSINTEESTRYITDQREQTDYYQSCVTDFNLKIEELENERVSEQD